MCLRLILRHMPPRIQALCSPTGATGACFTPFLRHNGGTMQLFPAARLVGHQSLSLGQSLSLCITFIQFQNHLVGIYVVYTWYIHGTYMVYTWYIHGIHKSLTFKPLSETPLWWDEHHKTKAVIQRHIVSHPYLFSSASDCLERLERAQ